MGKLLGGSSKSSSHSAQESTTKNLSYDLLRPRLLPSISGVDKSSRALTNFLSGNMAGFNKYSNSAGYDFAKDRGQGNIMAMLGASGLRNSGAAMKKLAEFNTDLRQQYIDKYLAALAQQSGAGLASASALSGAGGFSRSIGTSSGWGSQVGGIGQALGSALSAAAGTDGF